MGWEVGVDFIIFDGAPHAGGAWQSRWDSLTLSTVNRIHDLPGMSFDETLGNGDTEAHQKCIMVVVFDQQDILPMY